MQSCRCLQGPRDENQEILSTPSNTESSISLLSSSTKKKKNSDGNWKKVYFSKLIWWSLQSIYKWIVKKKSIRHKKTSFSQEHLNFIFKVRPSEMPCLYSRLFLSAAPNTYDKSSPWSSVRRKEQQQKPEKWCQDLLPLVVKVKTVTSGTSKLKTLSLLFMSHRY